MKIEKGKTLKFERILKKGILMNKLWKICILLVLILTFQDHAESKTKLSFFPESTSINIINDTDGINNYSTIIIPKKVEVRFNFITPKIIDAVISYASSLDFKNKYTKSTIKEISLNTVEMMKLLDQDSLLKLNNILKQKNGKLKVKYILYLSNKITIEGSPSITGPIIVYLLPKNKNLYYRYVDDQGKFNKNIRVPKYKYTPWKKFKYDFQKSQNLKIDYKKKYKDIEFLFTNLSKSGFNTYVTELNDLNAKMKDTNIISTKNATNLEKITYFGRSNLSSFISYPSLQKNMNHLVAVLRTKETSSVLSRNDPSRKSAFYENVVEINLDGILQKVHLSSTQYKRIRYMDSLSASCTKDSKQLLIQDPKKQTISLLTIDSITMDNNIIFDIAKDFKKDEVYKNVRLKSGASPSLDQKNKILYFSLFFRDDKKTRIMRKFLNSGNIEVIVKGNYLSLNYNYSHLAYVTTSSISTGEKKEYIDTINILNLLPGKSEKSVFSIY